MWRLRSGKEPKQRDHVAPFQPGACKCRSGTTPEAPASSQSQSAESSTSTVSVKPTKKQDPPKPGSLPAEPIDHAVRDALTNAKSRLTGAVFKAGAGYRDHLRKTLRGPLTGYTKLCAQLSSDRRTVVHAVLRYEEQVDSFVRDPHRYQMTFPIDLSGYQAGPSPLTTFTDTAF